MSDGGPMKIIQSVVIGGAAGAGAGGGVLAPVTVVAVVLVVVTLLSGVLVAVVHALVLLVAVVACAGAGGVVGLWAWRRHLHAVRPLGNDGTVISRDPGLVDRRTCGPCQQETPQVVRAAVAVALSPGGGVAALCAAHLAALHLAAATQQAIPDRRARLARGGVDVSERRSQR
jgi:hypothetical protein